MWLLWRPSVVRLSFPDQTALSLSKKVLWSAKLLPGVRAQVEGLHGVCWSQGPTPVPRPTPVAPALCSTAGTEAGVLAPHSQPEMLKLKALLLEEGQPPHFDIRFISVLFHGCIFVSAARVTFWGRRGRVVRLVGGENTPSPTCPSYNRGLRGQGPLQPHPQSTCPLLITLLGLVPQLPRAPGSKVS